MIDCAQGFSLDGETKTTQESSDQATITRTTRRERSHTFKGNKEETENHAKLVLRLSSFGLSPRFWSLFTDVKFLIRACTPSHTRHCGIRRIENTCSDCCSQ